MLYNSKLHVFLENTKIPLYKTIEDLWRFCEGIDYLYIYGVSKASSSILDYLKILKNDVEAYVVSDDRIDTYSEPMADGIPILSVSETVCRPRTGFILGLPEMYYNDAISNLKQKGFYDFFLLREYDKLAIVEKMHKHSLDSFLFAVNITDHCNLGCQMCSNFSQLSEEYFADINVFKRDLFKMRELLGEKYPGVMTITGGEPLLHPLVTEFIYFAREVFPLACLNLFTNGIELLKINNSFWKTLRECECTLILTIYPINLDFDSIIAKAAEFQVNLCTLGDTGFAPTDQNYRISSKITLDLSGEQPFGNFVCCGYYNSCITLREGRLHTCNIASLIQIFNQYFGESIEVSKYDYLDIYQANSFDEVASFVKKPPHLCRYCNVKSRRSTGGWARSRKCIEEYVD